MGRKRLPFPRSRAHLTPPRPVVKGTSQPHPALQSQGTPPSPKPGPARQGSWGAERGLALVLVRIWGSCRGEELLLPGGPQSLSKEGVGEHEAPLRQKVRPSFMSAVCHPVNLRASRPGALPEPCLIPHRGSGGSCGSPGEVCGQTRWHCTHLHLFLQMKSVCLPPPLFKLELIRTS